MKLLLLMMLSICSFSFGQTVLYTNTFEGAPGFNLNTTDMGGATSADNPWIVNNIYAGGSGTFWCPAIGFNVPFTVPAAPSQPAGITNNPTSTYLHVTPQIAIDGGGTLPAASYVAADGLCIYGGQSTFSRMSADVSTMGYDTVELDLWWMCGGSTLNFGEVYYSTNGGSSWTVVNCPATGTNQWINTTNWINSQITNPAWGNQATLRFGFRFVTGTSATGNEQDPGFAIDDITITGSNGCTPTTSTISETSCFSYTAPSGNIYTSSGTYVDTIPNAVGCDSLITINLTVNTVNTNTTQAGAVLTATAGGGATYQWLDCENNFAAISGATNASYTATSNGNYAVQVTQNGCTDTSACLTVTGIGLDELPASDFKLYPNPSADGYFVVHMNGKIESIEVFDALGRKMNLPADPASGKVDGRSLRTGKYLVKVKSANMVRIMPLVIIK